MSIPLHGLTTGVVSFTKGAAGGEQSYQNSESKNKNWNGTLRMNYHIGEAHTFTF